MKHMHQIAINYLVLNKRKLDNNQTPVNLPHEPPKQPHLIHQNLTNVTTTTPPPSDPTMGEGTGRWERLPPMETRSHEVRT